MRPQPAPVGFDDGSADRQTHSNSAGFRGVESFENTLEIFRINARPRIANRDDVPFVSLCLVLISNSRAPASIEAIASTAFRIKLRTTCCT